jgi:mRNA-degrading endonuclease RelE of RelBE toxin-antitoxin system
MASVEFKAHAARELEELDPVIGERIIEKIFWFEKNFNVLVPERLHYGFRDLYKLRVGDYRAVYSINGDVITIEKVRHRRDVYK